MAVQFLCDFIPVDHGELVHSATHSTNRHTMWTINERVVGSVCLLDRLDGFRAKKNEAKRLAGYSHLYKH